MSPSRNTQEVTDKNGEPINVGDTVTSKARGGKQTGTVEAVIATKEQAQKEGVINPPKVFYTDQHGHSVNHKPGTLVHGTAPQ